MNKSKDTPALLEDLTKLNVWSKLQQAEQTALSTATADAAAALHNVSVAKIAAGEHLSKVREILEPKRVFTVYLKTIFHMSKATAYRYIDLYTAAKTVLPGPVLEVAMTRPDDTYTIKALKDAPKPPRTNNVIKINEWLDNLQRNKPRLVTNNEKSPEDVKKAMFHSISLLVGKLAARQKLPVLVAVFGMALTEIGVSQPQKIEAEAIPESFRTKRGRPARKAA